MFALDEFPNSRILGVICGRFIDIQSLSVTASSTILNNSSLVTYEITIETQSDVIRTPSYRTTADSYLISPNGRMVLEDSIVTGSSTHTGGLNSIEIVSEEVETFL